MSHHHGLSILTRDASPATSGISDITVLSRSPSPVSDYEVVSSQPSTPITAVGSSPDRLREANGRFSPRKQATSSSPVNRLPKKLSSTPDTTPRQTCQTRALGGNSSMPEEKESIPCVAGEGGFGTMEILPREIRQMILGYAFDGRRGHPVTIRECCGPDTTERLRDACRKHGLRAKLDAGRFNILQVSKDMRAEANWVIYVKTTLLLDMNEAMAPYIPELKSSKSLRYAGSSVLINKRKSIFWETVARFRFVHLRVPENTVKYGVPVKFTGFLLRTTIMLYKLWEQGPFLLSSPVARFVRVHLGSMFQEMLPFNMESQAAARYGDLLDWLCRHSPTAEPDFDGAASECTYNLWYMLEIAGKFPGKYKWDAVVRTSLKKKDEGGLKALRRFQSSCQKNGVYIH